MPVTVNKLDTTKQGMNEWLLYSSTLVLRYPSILHTAASIRRKISHFASFPLPHLPLPSCIVQPAYFYHSFWYSYKSLLRIPLHSFSASDFSSRGVSIKSFLEISHFPLCLIVSGITLYSILTSARLGLSDTMPFSHHSHSGQFCPGHAKNGLEEVIQTAIAKKFQVFCLTEHMPRSQEDLYPEEVRTAPTICLSVWYGN